MREGIRRSFATVTVTSHRPGDSSLVSADSKRRSGIWSAWYMVKAKFRCSSSSTMKGGGMRALNFVPPPTRTVPCSGCCTSFSGDFVWSKSMRRSHRRRSSSLGSWPSCMRRFSVQSSLVRLMTPRPSASQLTAPPCTV